MFTIQVTRWLYKCCFTKRFFYTLMIHKMCFYQREKTSQPQIIMATTDERQEIHSGRMKEMFKWIIHRIFYRGKQGLSLVQGNHHPRWLRLLRILEIDHVSVRHWSPTASETSPNKTQILHLPGLISAATKRLSVSNLYRKRLVGSELCMGLFD